jgi:Spy/CpxP family protein refolding chaperone
MSKQLLLAVGVLAAGGAALAALPEPYPAPPGPNVVRIQKELGLSDTQAGQLKKLWSDQRKANIRRRADMAIARLEMQELLDSPTVDEKALNLKVKELTDLQGAALRARVDAHLALRKLVTPEQLEKLRALRHEGRGGRPGPPGRGERPPRPGGQPGGDEEQDDPGMQTPGEAR